MFDIDLLVKDIRLLWVALGNRSDDDLFITHRDKKSFEQSAWRISIGSRDNVNAELQVGLRDMRSTLKEELLAKMAFTEIEAVRLKQAMAKLSVDALS